MKKLLNFIRLIFFRQYVFIHCFLDYLITLFRNYIVEFYVCDEVCE